MTEQFDPGGPTSDDKLWAALAYVFTPVVPIILLLLEDKKNRPYIRAHNVQALAYGVVLWIVITLTTPLFGLGTFCVMPLGLILQLYWAYKAYQGEMVNIPVLTDFIQKQGWA
jgi:uncharacterized protein